MGQVVLPCSSVGKREKESDTNPSQYFQSSGIKRRGWRFLLDPSGNSHGEDNSITDVSTPIPNEYGQCEFGPFGYPRTWTGDVTTESAEQPCPVTFTDQHGSGAMTRTWLLNEDHNFQHIRIRVISFQINPPNIAVGCLLRGKGVCDDRRTPSRSIHRSPKDLEWAMLRGRAIKAKIRTTFTSVFMLLSFLSK